MKALIIGSKGQLGTSVTHTVPADIHFQALDLPEIDITDRQSVEGILNVENPDVVINAAAYTAVDRAEDEQELAFAVNATGPENLARTARRIGARLIHISTDYVFDGTACSPYRPSKV